MFSVCKSKKSVNKSVAPLQENKSLLKLHNACVIRSKVYPDGAVLLGEVFLRAIIKLIFL